MAERVPKPQLCRQNISSGMQRWGKIVGFKSPVGQVRTGRARSHALLIHVKQELIVGSDVHDEMLGRLL